MTEFEYDPTQLEFQLDPLPILATLREQHPVYFNPRLKFWTLSRFEDVMAASAYWESFSSSPKRHPEIFEAPTALIPRKMMDLGMFFLDPPRHDQLRSFLAGAFTPRRIAALEPAIRSTARDLLRRFAARGICEFAYDFAAPLVIEVIGSLLGIPRDKRWPFVSWAEKIDQRSADASRESARQEQDEALEAVDSYLMELVESRRTQPKEDLISALLAVELGGIRLTAQEIVSMGYQLMIGGIDTTAALLSNGALRLAQFPDERRKLVQCPELIPNGVEEMVRYDSPSLQSPPRVTTHEVHFRGTRIPAQSPVVLVWMAANHDPRQFPKPRRFDVTRVIGRHLGFGHGIHFCMGANLARLTARVAFEELLGAMPDFESAGPVERRSSVVIRPVGSLPLSFDSDHAERYLSR